MFRRQCHAAAASNVLRRTPAKPDQAARSTTGLSQARAVPGAATAPDASRAKSPDRPKTATAATGSLTRAADQASTAPSVTTQTPGSNSVPPHARAARIADAAPQATAAPSGPTALSVPGPVVTSSALPAPPTAAPAPPERGPPARTAPTAPVAVTTTPADVTTAPLVAGSLSASGPQTNPAMGAGAPTPAADGAVLCSADVSAAAHAAPVAPPATPLALPAAQTAGTSATQAAAAPPPNSQITAAVVRLAAGTTGQQVTISLAPHELGRVQISIDRHASGSATVAVAVDRPETLDLLRGDKPQLQAALERAGLTVASDDLTLHLRPSGDHAAAAGTPAPQTQDRTALPLAAPGMQAGPDGERAQGQQDGQGQGPRRDAPADGPALADAVSAAAPAAAPPPPRDGLDITA